MDVHTLVQQLSAHIGIPDLALDTRGMARLGFDERWAIDLEWDEAQRALHLYAFAGQLPAEGKEAFLTRLLAANLPGVETGSAKFALEPETGEVLLCARVDLETVSFESFKTVLENMLETLEQRVPEIFGSVTEAPTATQTPHQNELPALNAFA